MDAWQSRSRSDPTSMGKASSSLTALLGRLVQVAMVVLVLPLAVGLLQGLLEQVDVVSSPGTPFLRWIALGFFTYVGGHLFLYRPVGLFHLSHRMFSALAVWLFGGSVASVEGPGGTGKGSQRAKGAGDAQGSTLVAFSPYVIPCYALLVCAAGWLLGRWWDRASLYGPVSVLLGATMAFHWIMTADDLQRQRDRWHVETYLLAISLVFALTLLIADACLAWAIPGFSFVQALGEGLRRTAAIYQEIIQQLFF